MHMRVGLQSCLVALTLFGCEGVIQSLEEQQHSGVGGGSATNGGGTGTWQPPGISCDVSQYPGVTLEQAASLFARDVFPAMTSGQSQCVSCHGPSSMRRYQMAADAEVTFYQARGAQLFRDDPVSLLARVTNTDPVSRMPSAAPPMSDEVIESLATVSCMVQAYEANGGVAADEQFPPQLLATYTGEPIDSYDNPFINFVQLKSKVKAVFNDTWVRSNEDRFEKNIGLFGGVNFTTHFVEARTATPEFLLGMDALAPDVCGQAATNKTGPFTGLNLTETIIDTPAQTDTTIQGEQMTVVPATGGGNLSPSSNPTSYFCYTNCSLSQSYPIAAPGTYRVAVKGKTSGAGTTIQVKVTIGGVSSSTNLSFTDNTAYQEKSVDIAVPSADSMGQVVVAFVNDGNDNGVDRNIYFDQVKVTGPLGTGSGTQHRDAANAKIDTLFQKMLYRSATAAEKTSTYALLSDLAQLGTLPDAWSGVCEALVRHPDFLFTRPPSVELMTDTTAKDKLQLVSLTQRVLGRPPTASEFSSLSSSGFGSMVEQIFASQDFRDYYFNRIQLRIESSGTPESDEPARLWTYVTTTGRSYEEVLTADYSVDQNFQQISRPAEHGHSGVLSDKGYVNNKPGLPHYNYPARVLSGFMGMVFEVPPEVFDQRATATAASTVDPNSVCFSCHQLLTPLAHQRLRWDDDGNYRTTDSTGAVIDDTDRGLVDSYPYKGEGLEAFASKAVKKEKYIRRMINTQVKLLLGRELRAEQDERVLYKQLWDLSMSNNGDMRVVLKAVANSQTFRGEP